MNTNAKFSNEFNKMLSFIDESKMDMESLKSVKATEKPSERYYTQSGLQIEEGLELVDFKCFKWVPASTTSTGQTIAAYMAAVFSNGSVSVSRLVTSPSRKSRAKKEYNVFSLNQEAKGKDPSDLLRTDLIYDEAMGDDIAARFNKGLFKDTPSVFTGLNIGDSLRCVDAQTYYVAQKEGTENAKGYKAVIALWERI